MPTFEDLKDPLVFFSKSLGISIFNEEGYAVGKLKDFFVDYDDPYPQVLALQYYQGQHSFYIHWEDIKSFSYDKIIIKKDSQIRRGRVFPKVSRERYLKSLKQTGPNDEVVEYPPLGKVILDQQIVDTNGKKVVRVNDINFIKIGQYLRVINAEVGLRSLLRRLGFEPFFLTFFKIFFPKSSFLKFDPGINWKHVHAIPTRNFQSNLQINISNQDLKSFHPADLADLLEDLDNYGRDQIFSSLDPKLAAAALTEVEEDIQGQLLDLKNPAYIAEIVENMATDEATDLLKDLNKEDAQKVFDEIQDIEVKKEIKELIDYRDDTAGGIMSTEYLWAYESFKKNQILNFIEENHDDLENVHDIYILDKEDHLVGVCSMLKLLSSSSELLVKDLMTKFSDIQYLEAGSSWREVALMMNKYNLMNIPIIDDEQKMLGAVSVDDILPWLMDE